MEIKANPALREKALDLLREQYGIGQGPRPGIHQSELIHCLTRSYFDRTEPHEPGPRLTLLFAIGFAMEEVLLRPHEAQPEPIIIDGITCSLDTISILGAADLKTSRMAPNGRKDQDGFQLPDSWIKAAKAYRYVLNQTYIYCQCGDVFSQCSCASPSLATAPQLDFSFIVLHLIQPEITCWTITFTPEELEEHWAWLVDRSNQLESMLVQQDPMPYTTNEDYECESCTYKYKCDLIQSHRAGSGLRNLLQFRNI